MNKEMNECGRPFPGFMGGDFKKKSRAQCNKKVKESKVDKKQEIKEKVTKQLENKKPEEIIPSELKKSLEKMGVEVVDCYLEPKGAKSNSVPLGPNDIKVEIDLPAPEKKEEEKSNLMEEDKLVRKSSKKVDPVEDFKIECETPKKVLSSEEIEINQRKEYVKVLIGSSAINEEVLHFFVTSNLDLDREKFYQLMNEQKKYLLQ